MTPDEFSRLMERFTPFEHAPRIAVAVSGGADSLALGILAQGWAAQRGGEAIALIVDHRLRSESTREAAQVASWMEALGVPHHILTWAEGRAGSALQARAREARYRLLEGWCHDQGVLHLLTAHHRGDQAETFAMRAARGSGASGLAAMAAVKETRYVRLLRPLLAIPKDRLVAFLIARNHPWVEDASNRNPAFERVRVRRRLAHDGSEAALAAEADAHAGVRGRLEVETARLLARAVRVSSSDGLILDAKVLNNAPLGLAQRALSDVVTRLGGKPYPPHRDKLARAVEKLRSGEARMTLCGCLLTMKGQSLSIVREKPRRNLVT